MNDDWDVVIIGAGPAGLAAATLLAEQQARVLLLDEQPAPGGQIYRDIESMSDRPALLMLEGGKRARLRGRLLTPPSRSAPVRP